MDYVRLARDLKSMGKGCFVEHFELFTDRRLSRAAKVAHLQAATGYTAKSCQTRVSKAETIIAAGRARSALEMIVASGRVVPAQVQRARELLRGGRKAAGAR